MILSNQVECLICGDKPYSANRHDYKSCKCGNVAVDGGMDYFRRTGDGLNIRDMCIELEDDVANACLDNITEMANTKRNNVGILCGVARTLRDNGYCISKI